MTDDDADAVLRVYQAGLDSGDASFEVRAPDWRSFDAAHLPEHRFVAELGGHVVGWVAVSATSRRPVYAGVVEESVYVAPEAAGRGVGGALLHALVASTEEAGVWTLQAGVFPENAASLALHERAGFRVVGRRERVGRHVARGGRWRDVLLLERRSRVVD